MSTIATIAQYALMFVFLLALVGVSYCIYVLAGRLVSVPTLWAVSDWFDTRIARIDVRKAAGKRHSRIARRVYSACYDALWTVCTGEMERDEDEDAGFSETVPLMWEQEHLHVTAPKPVVHSSSTCCEFGRCNGCDEPVRKCMCDAHL